jgi:hypothetical protein
MLPLSNSKNPGGMNESITFVAYLTKHRHRIVNYSYFQAEGISIGSGTVESTVKQIGAHQALRRTVESRINEFPQVLLQQFVPTSMDSSQIKTCKTGMHPVTGII